jgi:putative peptidoglycan lipid II flippase
LTADARDDAPSSPTPLDDNAPKASLFRTTIWIVVATAVSRLAGLAREAFAASKFGITGQMSAFTVAFQIPNLIRALVADAALNGAFVPVFSRLLATGSRKEAYEFASALAFLLAVALGIVSALLVVLAPVLVPLAAPGFVDDQQLVDLTVTLAQLMFPIVPILAISALTIAMLHTYGTFGAPAFAPIAWNVVVIAFVIGAAPVDPTGAGVRTYALGVLVATIVQLLLPLPWLRGHGARLHLRPNLRNAHVRRVFTLMIPVSLSLGLVNLSLVVDSYFGTLIGEDIPAALDKAFRVMMVPQGLVPLALSTVLFPAMSRYVVAGQLHPLRRLLDRGLIASLLFLVPCTVALVLLADPITRVLYERGAFDATDTTLVASGVAYWSLLLPAQGVSVLLTRAFFSLERPWPVAALSGLNIAVNVFVALLLYQPAGMSGVILATVIGTFVMTALQWRLLNRLLPRSGSRLRVDLLRLLAAGGIQALVSWTALLVLSSVLQPGTPRDLVGIVVVGGAGLLTFVACARKLGVGEAREAVTRAQRWVATWR